MTEAFDQTGNGEVEVYPALSGHSVFLAESMFLLSHYVAWCSEYEGMTVECASEIPRNLLQLMNSEGIESAIMHISSLSEETAVLEVHRAGKKVVVLTRETLTQNDIDLEERLRSEGVAIVTKNEFPLTCFEEALGILAQLFEQQPQI
jgi:predicted transcriptional regulator